MKLTEPVEQKGKPRPVNERIHWYALVEMKGGGFQLWKRDGTLDGAQAVDAPDLRSISISRLARILGGS